MGTSHKVNLGVVLSVLDVTSLDTESIFLHAGLFFFLIVLGISCNSEECLHYECIYKRS